MHGKWKKKLSKLLQDLLDMAQLELCAMLFISMQQKTKGFLEGFALLENHQAFGNTQPIEDSFNLSIDILIEGMK